MGKKKKQYITPLQAVDVVREVRHITKQGVYDWCKKFGIGFKIGGRWVVDVDKLNKFLEGGYVKEKEK